MDAWGEFALKLLEVSPYLFIVALVLFGAYFFFKVSVNAVQKQSEKALEEMRRAYDDALQALRK